MTKLNDEVVGVRADGIHYVVSFEARGEEAR